MYLKFLLLKWKCDMRRRGWYRLYTLYNWCNCPSTTLRYNWWTQTIARDFHCQGSSGQLSRFRLGQDSMAGLDGSTGGSTLISRGLCKLFSFNRSREWLEEPWAASLASSSACSFDVKLTCPGVQISWSEMTSCTLSFQGFP